jgi:outer membrane protein assembly complex protein YaeT
MIRRAVCRLIGLVLGAALMAGTAGCRDVVGTRVTGLGFEGNSAFSDGDLTRVLATRKTGFLPWSRPEIFDRAIFEADLQRLRAFYIDRGYPDARVVDVDVEFNETGDEVDLTVHLDEGEPILVERLAFEGFVALSPGILNRIRAIPLQEGHPLDRHQLLESRDHAIFVLRDNGFPNPRVETREADGSAEKRVVVTFVADPGEAAVFGAITVEGADSVSDTVVLRTLAFEPGRPYRVSEMLESQTRLFGLGLFEFAHVKAAEDADMSASDGRAGVPMVVTVAEGRATTLRFGVGYGSEEGPRGSLDWRHRNFLGAARQFGLEGRYSNRLRGGGLDFVQPYVGSGAVSMNLKTGAWYANESTYSSRSIGFSGGLTFRNTVEQGLNEVPTENVLGAIYTNESLRHTIKPEVLGDLEALDELIALGIDPVSGTSSGRLGSLELSYVRTAVKDPLNPQGGYAVSGRVEHAAPWLGGTYDFNEIHTEGRVFVPLGRVVWATRAQAGAILANRDEDVPFSARYFLGGSSTLRGWGRYEVAPLTSDGLPIGGRAVFDLTTELRVPLSDAFGAVVFVDAGDVWPDVSSVDFRGLRVAVGPGLRWVSGFGVVRADVGVQLNPIPNLLVDGQLERRRWRIHLSFGHAF